MIVIPAIDIRAGRVVRLSQGEFSRQTVYSDSPVEMALKWESFGVGMIHIVDLDGALEGSSKNLAIVSDIARRVKAKIELGGGIRDEESIGRAIDAGVDKVVIGTKALDQKFLQSAAGRFRDNIVVGIDARDGMVHTKGWLLNTDITAVELAKRIGSTGIKTINYTDISKDGMLGGPNEDSLREIIRATGLNIIAAGGVSSIEDILKLKKLEAGGLKGVIVGKALYEGKLDLAETIAICSQKE